MIHPWQKRIVTLASGFMVSSCSVTELRNPVMQDVKVVTIVVKGTPP